MPNYKKGDRDLPGNYRPVSILPIISKVIEKIVNNQFINYLDKFNYIFELQYGFRKKTQHQLSLVKLAKFRKLSVFAPFRLLNHEKSGHA